MERIIKGIYCFKYDENEELFVIKLPFKPDELKFFSKTVDFPKTSRLKDIEKSASDASKPNKYVIYNDNEDYRLTSILEIYKYIDEDGSNIEILSNPSEIFDDDNKFKYTSVAYLSSYDNKDQINSLHIFKLKDNIIVKDKMVINFMGIGLIHDKMATDGSNYLKPSFVNNGFFLPQKDCICNLDVKITNENVITTLNVFKGTELDDVLNTNKYKLEYADRTLERFNEVSNDNKLKLTSSHIEVSFTDIETIKETVKNDIKHLAAPLASFKGTKRSKIQNINLQQLQDVLKVLNEYVGRNASLMFSKENIPTIENGKLIVDEKQVPIFVSLLSNKIIQELLDGTIRIPYYDNME